MRYFDAIANEWKIGDMVAAIATPIARAIGHPCVDKETRQLKPNSKCAERKARLNELTSKPKTDS